MSNTPRHELGVFKSEPGDRTPAPAMNCVSVDSEALDRLEVRLKAVEKQGDEVLRAIVGHPQIGHMGLVGRQDRLEVEVRIIKEQQEKNDRKLFRFGTILTLCGALLVFAKDFFIGWLSNNPHKP